MTQTTPFANQPERSWWWRWSTWVSLVVTLGPLGVLLSMQDFAALWQHIATANPLLIVVGGLAHYATYGVRGARWWRCLRHVSPHATIRTCSVLMFFYNAVDNVIPAKLTDVYAAHLAYINSGVGRAAALGSIVFLRMVDAWFVLLLAVLASWWLFAASMPSAVLWSLLLGVLIAIGTTCVLLICVVWRRAFPAWLPQRVSRLLGAFHTGMWPEPRQLGPIALLTVGIWALETLWVIMLVLAFDLRMRPFEGLFLTTIPLLASAFPFTPSGAGMVELTMFSCLRLLYVPTALAASVTVVNRLIDYWLHIALGAVTWALRRTIGLRTWREVPLDPVCVTPPSNLSAAQEEPRRVSYERTSQ